MKTAIEEIIKAINNIWKYKRILDNPEYWIKKAQQEADFPANPVNPRIYIEVKSFKIEVSVHDDNTTKIWINGQWFDTSWPDKLPNLENIDLNNL